MKRYDFKNLNPGISCNVNYPVRARGCYDRRTFASLDAKLRLENSRMIVSAG